MSARRWTLKEIVQGKPLGHPSHALFVHFPAALPVAALGFDVLSRAGAFPQAPVAATWLLAGAVLTAIPAIVTGLVDWAGMVPGSSKRAVATRHMLLQLTAAAGWVAGLALRWGDREAARARWSWIAVGAIAVAIQLVGQYLGGKLVYEMGMRVGRPKVTSG